MQVSTNALITDGKILLAIAEEARSDKQGIAASLFAAMLKDFDEWVNKCDRRTIRKALPGLIEYPPLLAELAKRVLKQSPGSLLWLLRQTNELSLLSLVENEEERLWISNEFNDNPACSNRFQYLTKVQRYDNRTASLRLYDEQRHQLQALIPSLRLRPSQTFAASHIEVCGILKRLNLYDTLLRSWQKTVVRDRQQVIMSHPPQVYDRIEGRSAIHSVMSALLQTFPCREWSTLHAYERPSWCLPSSLKQTPEEPQLTRDLTNLSVTVHGAVENLQDRDAKVTISINRHGDHLITVVNQKFTQTYVHFNGTAAQLTETGQGLLQPHVFPELIALGEAMLTLIGHGAAKFVFRISEKGLVYRNLDLTPAHEPTSPPNYTVSKEVLRSADAKIVGVNVLVAHPSVILLAPRKAIFVQDTSDLFDIPKGTTVVVVLQGDLTPKKRRLAQRDGVAVVRAHSQQDYAFLQKTIDQLGQKHAVLCPQRQRIIIYNGPYDSQRLVLQGMARYPISMDLLAQPAALSDQELIDRLSEMERRYARLCQATTIRKIFPYLAFEGLLDVIATGNRQEALIALGTLIRKCYTLVRNYRGQNPAPLLRALFRILSYTEAEVLPAVTTTRFGGRHHLFHLRVLEKLLCGPSEEPSFRELLAGGKSELRSSTAPSVFGDPMKSDPLALLECLHRDAAAAYTRLRDRLTPREWRLVEEVLAKLRYWDLDVLWANHLLARVDIDSGRGIPIEEVLTKTLNVDTGRLNAWGSLLKQISRLQATIMLDITRFRYSSNFQLAKDFGEIRSLLVALQEESQRLPDQWFLELTAHHVLTKVVGLYGMLHPNLNERGWLTNGIWQVLGGPQSQHTRSGDQSQEEFETNLCMRLANLCEGKDPPLPLYETTREFAKSLKAKLGLKILPNGVLSYHLYRGESRVRIELQREKVLMEIVCPLFSDRNQLCAQSKSFEAVFKEADVVAFRSIQSSSSRLHFQLEFRPNWEFAGITSPVLALLASMLAGDDDMARSQLVPCFKQFDCTIPGPVFEVAFRHTIHYLHNASGTPNTAEMRFHIATNALRGLVAAGIADWKSNVSFEERLAYCMGCKTRHKDPGDADSVAKAILWVLDNNRARLPTIYGLLAAAVDVNGVRDFIRTLQLPVSLAKASKK